MPGTPKRVVFAGYAPVHFLCFRPIYERLRRDPSVSVWLSGGFKRGKGDDVSYDLEGFYDPFDVDPEHVIPCEQLAREDFDVLVCAHLSDAFFPRSVGRTVQIYHGVSFKNLAVREKALRYDLLCLPGRYHAERYQESGLVRPGASTCLLTGFPKSDALVAPEFDRDAVLRAESLDPTRPTILFAPTGEKRNALETVGEEAIRSIAADGRFNLMVKPHDHAKNAVNWFERLAPLESDSVRVVRGLDVVPYLRAADLLISDASSVCVEYTLVDRPIVFLESPKLLRRVEKRAPALDLETYGRRIGTVAEDPAGVAAVCADALAHPERERELRQAMAAHVFHRPGGAAERVAEVVRFAAGLRAELPGEVEVLEPCLEPAQP